MTEWNSERLGSAHRLDSFDCGVPALNDWLVRHALVAQAQDTARTYVWTRPDSPVVMAYYAITPTRVLRSDVSSDQAKGSGPVAAYLLAKLAVHRDLHGQGLGKHLLLDALEVIVRATEQGGGRLIVVDAIDDRAAEFYKRYDFKPVKGTPNRLVMKVATARNALGLGSVQVSADSAVGLVSMLFKRPDGTVAPYVANTSEARLVAQRLSEIADENELHGTSGQQIDLRAIFVDVLGRDPLAE